MAAEDAVKPPLLPPALRWSGPILALGYRVGSSLHRVLSRPQFAPIATVCIGNITVGGTGKTPAVKYFARELVRRGRKPAVLMRGYKEQASDEGREVEARLQTEHVPVIIGADRIVSAFRAKEQGRDVALLDDGFQHWRLARDLDIVLIDATDPFGSERRVPHGRLRESPSALARAGVIIITRADTIRAQDLRTLKDRITALAPSAVVALAKHAPVHVKVVGRDETFPLDRLITLPVIGACGIGNPEGFRRTLDQVGAVIKDFVAFPDHHRFTQDDLKRLQHRAKEVGAKVVVVTEKDAAKLVLLPQHEIPLWNLEVDFQIPNGEAEVWAKIEAAVKTGDGRAY